MIHNLDLNLRTEMKELIDKTEYYVMLQRTSKKIRCSCFNNKYQEPGARCPKCLGTGRLFKFEKLKVFKQDYPGSPETAITKHPIGELSFGYKTFYFEHDTFPQQNDYIWEVAWDKNKPIKLNTLYRIQSTTELRGESGRIEFKQCVAQKEVLDKDFKNMYIGKAWKDVK